ncbi:unnamed protein product [Sympodiomycopsis kandeliae]
MLGRMEFLTNIFGCCFPGRRRSHEGNDETSPLLSNNTSQNNASSSSANQSNSQSTRDTSRQGGKPPSTLTTALSQQNNNDGESCDQRQIRQLEPTYSIQDLAVITGWARSQFLNINDPHVLSQKSDSQSNKRNSFVQCSDRDDDGQQGSDQDPEEDRAQNEAKANEINKKVQQLVEDLAKGISYNGGWTQDQASSNESSQQH